MKASQQDLISFTQTTTLQTVWVYSAENLAPVASRTDLGLAAVVCKPRQGGRGRVQLGSTATPAAFSCLQQLQHVGSYA